MTIDPFTFSLKLFRSFIQKILLQDPALVVWTKPYFHGKYFFYYSCRLTRKKFVKIKFIEDTLFGILLKLSNKNFPEQLVMAASKYCFLRLRNKQYKQKEIHNHSKNIWDKPWFLFEITHYGKSSIFFQEIFTSTDKNFISGGGLNVRQ